MIDMKKIAEKANMIINGYAFTIIQAGIQVVNLERGTACVLDKKDQVIESSMDDICGYYLYFTSHCIIEAMHVHASDRKLTESGSAKFFVMSNGDTTVENRGILNDREILKIREFIKENYKETYISWSTLSENGFYGE